MNADASAGVHADVAVGARVPAVQWIAIGRLTLAIGASP
jgi:hypothetical protein